MRFVPNDPSVVSRLHFYLHSVEFIGKDDRLYPMALLQRSPWQSDRVALLQLAAAHSPARRDVIEGMAQRRPYIGVRFSIGVPFELNHSNQLTAAAPLNRAELFWSWQTGYKFLRLDLAGEHEASFHLGSTGCSSAAALRPPREPCAQPNVMRVELRGFDPLSQPILVRMQEIVTALTEAESRACTGEYAEPACAKAFATTGLDLKSGLCTPAAGDTHLVTAAEHSEICTSQRLFAAP